MAAMRTIGLSVLGVASLVLSACGSSPSATSSSSMPGMDMSTPMASATTTTAPPASPGAVGASGNPFADPLPGMPPIPANGVYGDATTLSQAVSGDPAYIYVPDSNESSGGTTTVIDQNTHKIVRVLQSGILSQHVTPSHDLRHIFVEASVANRLFGIDPATGQAATSYPIERPYNLYFTPDGKFGVEMDEQHQKIQFTDPSTFKVVKTISDPACQGPNHADFSANGRYFIVSCEFSGELLKIDTVTQEVVGHLSLGAGAMPQDVRLAPDGRSFFVAAMMLNKLVQIPWNDFTVAKEFSTMTMPHGIYFSRDQKRLFLTARGAGAIQVFDLARSAFVATWQTPQHYHLDMGGLSVDGKTLWISARNEGYVLGFDTTTGQVIATIRVGGMPHGLLVWPQPGRYSIGHTGVTR
jgi:DNA-binding beta-propeller fold protein YncE